MATTKSNTLSNREKQILQHVARGMSSADIGRLLELSPHTVQQHRKNINKKMKFKSIVDWVNYAHKAKLN